MTTVDCSAGGLRDTDDLGTAEPNRPPRPDGPTCEAEEAR